jgi:hypothetical protein
VRQSGNPATMSWYPWPWDHLIPDWMLQNLGQRLCVPTFRLVCPYRRPIPKIDSDATLASVVPKLTQWNILNFVVVSTPTEKDVYVPEYTFEPARAGDFQVVGEKKVGIGFQLPYFFTPVESVKIRYS